MRSLYRLHTTYCILRSTSTELCAPSSSSSSCPAGILYILYTLYFIYLFEFLLLPSRYEVQQHEAMSFLFRMPPLAQQGLAPCILIFYTLYFIYLLSGRGVVPVAKDPAATYLAATGAATGAASAIVAASVSAASRYDTSRHEQGADAEHLSSVQVHFSPSSCPV